MSQTHQTGEAWPDDPDGLHLNICENGVKYVTWDILEAVSMAMLPERRRRMAVIDDSGRLLGLLCLKRDGTGYCSDESIRQRAAR